MPNLRPPGRGGGPGGGPGFMARIHVEKPKDMKGTLLRLWAFFQKERRWLLVVFILAAAGSGVALLAPRLIGRAVDTLGLGDQTGLGRLVLLLALAYGMDAVCQFTQGFLMAGVSQRTVRLLRSALFDRYQNLPAAFFDARPHGDLMSRVTNDIDNISTTISTSTSQLMSLAISLVGSLVMMIVISPVLTLALLVPACLALLLTRTITTRTRPLFTRQQAALGALSAQLEESVSGLTVVHGFNHEEAMVQEFDALNVAYYKTSLSALIWSGFIMPMMNVINNLSLVLISAAGSQMALRGLVTIGVIATFISYSRQFIRPLNDVANIYNTLQTAVAGAERGVEIFDQAPEAPDPPDAQPMPPVQGQVTFENVRFGYRPDVPVIQDVSFSVPSGASLALVGPTGAGKTTIVNLLARFYEMDAGSIRIDGLDIRAVQRGSLRQAFGIVLQDTYLFSGTILENIRYGNPAATQEQVEEAARRASAHEFIRRLQDGYQTILTESGRNLSAGQRQLLAIARAILANAPILILDEATSNVDTRTELSIQEAMLELMRGRTTFIIAHRLSTIQDANRILVIDGGRIVEQGSHAELVAGGGIYAKMWEKQGQNAS
jgi:ATP-binding cassette subfamily B protein